MYRDLTRGPISRSLILFALPMMAGNLLQQFYNIADTLIVGRALGAGALAAVGSAYTLMTFLTSVFLGLSMGAGALFSIYQGRGDQPALRAGIAHALVLILSVTLVINAAVYAFLPQILAFLRVPAEVWDGMRTYLLIIFAGLLATSIYNYLSCLLRALAIPPCRSCSWPYRRCSMWRWIYCLCWGCTGALPGRHGRRLSRSIYQPPG